MPQPQRPGRQRYKEYLERRLAADKSACGLNYISEVGWDAPKPISLWRPCKTSTTRGGGNETGMNPLPLGMGRQHQSTWETGASSGFTNHDALRICWDARVIAVRFGLHFNTFSGRIEDPCNACSNHCAAEDGGCHRRDVFRDLM